jgi:hypothetical protein
LQIPGLVAANDILLLRPALRQQQIGEKLFMVEHAIVDAQDRLGLLAEIGQLNDRVGARRRDHRKDRQIADRQTGKQT